MAQEKQYFSRIKDIKAIGGMVVIEVYKATKDVQAYMKGEAVKTTICSIKEAAQRARALNAMVVKTDMIDRPQAMEIVEAIIQACLEAQRQQLKPKGRMRPLRMGFVDNKAKVKAMLRAMRKAECKEAGFYGYDKYKAPVVVGASGQPVPAPEKPRTMKDFKQAPLQPDDGGDMLHMGANQNTAEKLPTDTASGDAPAAP